MTELSQDLREALVQTAREVRDNAYAPFSRFRVGAAVLADDGQIYPGVNVENSSFSLTLCAERSAAAAAVTAGAKSLRAVAVVSDIGAAPCGACRQFLYELGSDMRVVLIDAKKEQIRETTLEELLPGGFMLR